MRICEKVKHQIVEERRKWHGDEFGGYLIVKNDCVQEIVFDVEYSNGGYVEFGVKALLKLPKNKQKFVRGWFHAHPITGLSQTDVMTTMKLTNFWGRCYTVSCRVTENYCS